MKRSFLLLCTVLLVLGCALPCAAYRLACMALVVQGTAPSAAEAASVTSEESSRVAPSPADTADTVCFTDQSTGQTITLPLREYLIGAVAAEMPVSWPDEALKAQAVAAHSYALYRRDHSTGENGAWFTADPARRQGCLTDAVLHSYWGTAYAANYARLSALVDAVQTQVLYYEDAPAGTSYFAMSNGRTEASEKVWGTALPYLVPVDSSTDTAADNYEYTLNLSAAQLQQLLAERLGIAADLSPGRRSGSARRCSLLRLCGQTCRSAGRRCRVPPCASAGAAQRLLYGGLPERQPSPLPQGATATA
ncbi:MAG: SpoIID/LytB domain-containing protein [Faecalibacterium prausnitzii]